MNRKEALELLNNRSCKVLAGCLGISKATNCNGVGYFTTGEVSKYGTVLLKEIGVYVKLESIFEIQDLKGNMKSVCWHDFGWGR